MKTLYGEDPFSFWLDEQPDFKENMESNVVMTLDDSDYSRTDDGKWNDVAESTLHHTVCEYTNDYVKGSDCKLLYY